MKKYIISLLIGLVLVATPVLAVTNYDRLMEWLGSEEVEEDTMLGRATRVYTRSMIPEETDVYDVGTSTLEYNGYFNNMVINGTCTGTGCSSGSGASYFADLLDVTTTTPATGDVYYLDATGKIVNLGVGSNDDVLTLASGIPSWAASASGDAFAWTPDNTYSTAVNATGTPLWIKGDLFVTNSLYAGDYFGDIGAGTVVDTGTLDQLIEATKEPTGHKDASNSTMTFDSATRTFTIDTASSYQMYVKGEQFIRSTATSTLIASTTGIHYIYFDGDGVLLESTVEWDISAGDAVPTAIVYWSGASGVGGLLSEERHGTVMDVDTHEYLHDTIGTRYESGLTGTFTDPATWDTTSGFVHDEDIDFSIGATSTTQVSRRFGGGSDFTFSDQQTSLITEVAGVIQYDNSGVMTDVTNNQYVAYWVFATNNFATPIGTVMGQQISVTLAGAEAANTPASLDIANLPTKEAKLLYRVIIRRSGTAESVEDVTDYRQTAVTGQGGYVPTDHGTLSGLPNDDHPQYGEIASTETITGAWSHTGDLTSKNTTSTNAIEVGVCTGANIDFVNDMCVLDDIEAEGMIYGDVTGDLTGVASSCTVAATEPTNCAAGSYPLGVDTSWDVESCTDATTEINSVVNGLGGTNLTCAAQSCSVDDSFIKLVGDTGMTGTFDFGGADDFEIPNGANPTVDTAGQIAVNTTSSSIRYYDGTAERALYDTVNKTFTIPSSTLDSYEGSTVSSTIPLGVASDHGETWLSAVCFNDAGTTELEFMNGVTAMEYQKVTTATTTRTLATNNTFGAYGKRYVRVGVTSGFNSLSCTVKIRILAD